MKRMLLVTCLTIQGMAFGQPVSPVQAIIDAENSFAGLSKRGNTVNAFLNYLDDSSILVVNNRPAPGISTWRNRKPDSSLLFWWPVFVGVSSDGELGFSTGPWEWSKTRADPPQAFGYYASVWKKNNAGAWKLAVDMGISFPESKRSNPALVSVISQKNNDRGSPISAKEELLAADQDYITLLNKQSVSFLPVHFTDNGHLLRDGYTPCTSPPGFSAIEETGLKFLFGQTGGGIASSRDLGYTYGIVKKEIVKEGAAIAEEKSYLRVWKKENDRWKIVLDVISGN